MRHAARRADVVVAISEFTAQGIRRRFGREARVVPLAAPGDMGPAAPAEVTSVRAHYRLAPRFALYVGRVEPRKDVAVLSAACRAVGVPLVIAGPAPRAPVPGAVHLGYVPRHRLAALYGAAAVVGYPSRYEGFGLPPLEAMACGAPVVAYDIPPLRETLGDAAELVAPGDRHALAGALRRVLGDHDRRAELSARGVAVARRRSWAHVARDTAEVYRSLGVHC